MGGLYGQELELRRRGIEISFFHNEALESRRTKLAFGMPYEILLGVLCNSNANTAAAATFFLDLLQFDFEPTRRYLEGFIFVLNQQCDLSSCELEVRAEYKHTPMDFPRPSPARLLVWDFAARLAANSMLYSRLRSSEGADGFSTLPTAINVQNVIPQMRRQLDSDPCKASSPLLDHGCVAQSELQQPSSLTIRETAHQRSRFGPMPFRMNA